MAAHYLNAAMDDSQESYLKALRNVAQARQMAKVARDTGVQRESLYRILSEQGNPTLETLRGIYDALGLKLVTATKESEHVRSFGDSGICELVHPALEAIYELNETNVSVSSHTASPWFIRSQNPSFPWGQLDAASATAATATFFASPTNPTRPTQFQTTPETLRYWEHVPEVIAA
jgi:probable addiction module antidote protein